MQAKNNNKHKTYFYVSVLLFLCVSLGRASQDEFRAVQRAIANSGANWTAGETGISKLSPDVRRGYCTADLPFRHVSGDVLPHRQTHPDHAVLRSQFDWRDYQGYNWITSVKNQGGCGSCAAFASVGALEATMRIVSDDPTLDVDLSEQHLFSCGGGDCTEGWYIGYALDYMSDYGVPDEACLPYSAVDDNCWQTCTDWRDRAIKIDSWEFVTQTIPDDDAIKLTVKDRPVTTYLEVYTDFFYYTGGVYEYVYGTFAGGHFVDIIGWNDDLSCWICKNSWDKTWGEEGFFRILRGTTMIGSYAGAITYTAPATPTPTPFDEPTSTPAQEPTHTSAPAYTSTPCPTQSPDPPTATPESPTFTPLLPSSTPAATSTNAPKSTSIAFVATSTPEPEPPATGISCLLNNSLYHPGDPFTLSIRSCNGSPYDLPVETYVILDVFGHYWFWPEWSESPNSKINSLPALDCEEETIVSFDWPAGSGSAQGLRFWAAMIDPVTKVLTGSHSVCEFDYTSE
jgi:C1A family cysteine protease